MQQNDTNTSTSTKPEEQQHTPESNLNDPENIRQAIEVSLSGSIHNIEKDDANPEEGRLMVSFSNNDESTPSQPDTPTKQPIYNEAKRLGGEILFPPPKDTSISPQQWTKDQWTSTSSTRELVHCGTLWKLCKATFWFTKPAYETRTLALFHNPNLVLLLKRPRNIQEVTDIIGPTSSKNTLNSYYIVESVMDPKMCKLRLSPLTTKTSIPMQTTSKDTTKPLSENDLKNDPIRKTCFELITPVETHTFTLIMNNQEVDDSPSGTLFLETLFWEHVIAKALYLEHDGSEEDSAWKHQLVLGTLHSYVVLGDYDMLQRSLDALAADEQTNEDEQQLNPYGVIDRVDENGRTALHYACIRRSSPAVALLITHGANCSLPDHNKTPCHLSAEKLDGKSLSTILSSPSRPDPNALDDHGRTPTYLAVVEGVSVGGRGDSVLLNRCLAALEAWGGER